MTADSVDISARLADFVCAWRRSALDPSLLHEAKRLLLNQLKASAEGCQQPQGQQLLARAAAAKRSEGTGACAHLWWTGQRAAPEDAAMFNARLLRLLDFGDTHLPTLGQFTAGVLPRLLAWAELGQQDGARVLTALAVGLEVAIAGALVNPPHQDAAAALTLGATAAHCTLNGLDRATTVLALSKTAGVWPVQAEAADAALDDLGKRWRLRDIALHCRPLPVTALAPVEAVLALRPLAGGRELQQLRLRVSPRAGSHAGGDAALRDAMAAAWLMGQFTSEEGLPALRDHPATVRLRERITLCPDVGITGIEACMLAAKFADGSCENIEIDAFLGAPAQPLCDSQLSELFRNAADALVLPRRCGEILQALWALDHAADVCGLMSLLRRPA